MATHLDLDSVHYYLTEARQRAEAAGGATVEQLAAFATISALRVLTEQIHAVAQATRDQTERIGAHINDLRADLTA